MFQDLELVLKCDWLSLARIYQKRCAEMRRVLITVTRQCVKLICGGGESENWEGKIIFFFSLMQRRIFLFISVFLISLLLPLERR